MKRNKKENCDALLLLYERIVWFCRKTKTNYGIAFYCLKGKCNEYVSFSDAFPSHFSIINIQLNNTNGTWKKISVFF